MMGFAGQLSLGHALYVGLGAYSTAVLFIHFGIGPWLGLLVAVPVRWRSARSIGFLAFRFRVARRLFRDPDDRLRRIRADRLRPFRLGRWLGRLVPAGQAIHRQRSVAAARLAVDVLLRDARRDGAGVHRLPCCCCTAGSAISGWPSARTSRRPARSASTPSATRCIAVVISAGMTSFAGVFYAFFYNNLFPEQVFHILRSIEMIIGPIIGGVGTLFGPILGAFVLTGLSEGLQRRAAAIRHRRSRRQAGVLRRLPAAGRDGDAGRHLALAVRGGSACAERGAMSALLVGHRRQQALPRPRRGRRRQLRRGAGRDLRADRAERRRQDHPVQHDRRRIRARTAAPSRFAASASTACRPTRSAGAASAAPSRSCGRSRASPSRRTS